MRQERQRGESGWFPFFSQNLAATGASGTAYIARCAFSCICGKRQGRKARGQKKMASRMTTNMPAGESVEHFRQPGSGSTMAYPTGWTPTGGRPRGRRTLIPVLEKKGRRMMRDEVGPARTRTSRPRHGPCARRAGRR